MVIFKLIKFKFGYFFFFNEFRKFFSIFLRIIIYNFSCVYEWKILFDVCVIVFNFYWDVYWYIFNYVFKNIFIFLYDLDLVGLV